MTWPNTASRARITALFRWLQCAAAGYILLLKRAGRGKAIFGPVKSPVIGGEPGSDEGQPSQR
jgi:hypothetical protein